MIRLLEGVESMPRFLYADGSLHELLVKQTIKREPIENK